LGHKWPHTIDWCVAVPQARCPDIAIFDVDQTWNSAVKIAQKNGN